MENNGIFVEMMVVLNKNVVTFYYLFTLHSEFDRDIECDWLTIAINV